MSAEVRFADGGKMHGRAHAGADRLGEGLLGGEALGQETGLVRGQGKGRHFAGGQHALRQPDAIALVQGPQARDRHDVRAYPEDHAALPSLCAWTVSSA